MANAQNANYANSAGSANTANSAGYANSSGYAANAGNANYANTAGYANSSGLPAYSQWQNAVNSGTGYIYAYLDYGQSQFNCAALRPFGVAYFSRYYGASFGTGEDGCGDAYYTRYIFLTILSNN
ncbi:MAG: hypothetical protein ACYCSB_06820 [bacterium]